MAKLAKTQQNNGWPKEFKVTSEIDESSVQREHNESLQTLRHNNSAARQAALEELPEPVNTLVDSVSLKGSLKKSELPARF